MFERFDSESKGAVLRALETARRLGAEQVEPEHMLLALAEGRADPAARALAEAGLDAQQIECAIEEDLVAALDVVGVPASVVASTPVYPSAKHPGIGLAAKAALERSVQAAARRGERKLGAEHLLLGLVDPPAVSLRRVLARLDVEPDRLAALVRVEAAAGR
jgi:ATP-dependent Clp protease ATP-binding subunit ClpA